jgi:hypothetical protein
MKQFNMKSLFVGLIIGIILTASMSTVFASTIKNYVLLQTKYNIIINGKDYKDDKLPILTYNGNTYAPMRSMLAAAGLNVNFNSETKIVNITNNNVNNNATNISINSGSNNMEERITYTPDGLTVLYYKNIAYVPIGTIDYRAQKFGYRLKKDLNIVGSPINLTKNGEIIIKNVPVPSMEGTTGVEYNYYITNIMPLFK